MVRFFTIIRKKQAKPEDVTPLLPTTDQVPGGGQRQLSHDESVPIGEGPDRPEEEPLPGGVHVDGAVLGAGGGRVQLQREGHAGHGAVVTPEHLQRARGRVRLQSERGNGEGGGKFCQRMAQNRGEL